jgi:hypothetical protein
MFNEAQQNQHHPTVQPANGCDHPKIQKALYTLQLLSEVTITLFVAGVVVPSFLRSRMVTSHALAVGSLHTLTIGGVTLSYTLHNLVAAILGGLLGSLVALAIEFPATFAKAARNFLIFWRADWKCFLSRQPRRPSFDDNRSLA